jgi:hypothetical protein
VNCLRCGYPISEDHPAALGRPSLHAEADCSVLLAGMRSTSGRIRDQLAAGRPDPAGPPGDPLEQVDRRGVPFGFEERRDG